MLDAASLGSRPGSLATELFAAGVDWIQLRERGLSDEHLFRIAVELVSARDRDRDGASKASHIAAGPLRSGARVLVNRRVDIALAARADGVHLGFDAIEVGDARALLGDQAWIGASLHSCEEIEPAIRSGVSYAHLAPIWDPISKPASRPALGPETLSRAAAAGLPLLAQGGIDATRCATVLAAGAMGIAVTGSIARAADPASIAASLRHQLDRADPPTRAPTP